MKQTAVEWLEDFMNNGKQKSEGIISLAFSKAKEMEKEQIIDAFEVGYEHGACVNEEESIYHGSNYYNKTFKSE